MKKTFLASGALIVAALFSIQPATADVPDIPPTAAVETITADTTAVLDNAEPAVESVPAPDPYDYLKNPIKTDPADLLPAPTKLPTAPVWTPAAPTEPSTAPLEAPVTAPDVIREDDPRFDCNTMGNLLCGNAQYAVPVSVEEILTPQCANPATVDDPAVLRWCEWKAAQ